VDGSGRALLTGYGLAPLKHTLASTGMAAPEAVKGLLAPEHIHTTSTSVVESKPADIFAFAILVFELFTGKPPFDGQHPAMAAFSISRGKRPEFPPNAEDIGLTAQMQDFIDKCWRHDPLERPAIDDVVKTLELLESNKCVQRSPSEQNPYRSNFLM
jgi:serine/threonine protein kinase